MCRICHCEGDADLPLISPCYCAGSLQFVHQSCLQQWIKSSDAKCCELCKFHYIMHTKVKPFTKWEKLEMSPVERRKVLCSITFHAVALTCVVWSLYVLIERTAEEVRAGSLEWPFWTKLIVVAVGFTGGLVFMYVQCRMYAQLLRRWRAFNRTVYVQNAPDKPPPPPPDPPQRGNSPEEDEFHSCLSGSDTDSKHEVPREGDTDGPPDIASMKGSTRTTLTSVIDPTPQDTLNEVVVVPPEDPPARDNSFLNRQPQQTAS